MRLSCNHLVQGSPQPPSAQDCFSYVMAYILEETALVALPSPPRGFHISRSALLKPRFAIQNVEDGPLISLHSSIRLTSLHSS